MFLTAQLPWKDLLGQPLDRDHVVQLYRDERVLVDAVSLFAGTALGRRESVVLVATPEHLNAVERRLADDGFELSDLKQWGQLTVRNADVLLYGFMVDGRPIAAVQGLVGGLLQDMKPAGGSRVRRDGEPPLRHNIAPLPSWSRSGTAHQAEGISLFAPASSTIRAARFSSSPPRRAGLIPSGRRAGRAAAQLTWSACPVTSHPAYP